MKWHKSLILLFAALITVLTVVAPGVPAIRPAVDHAFRTWTDDTGQFSVKARLVKFTKSSVELFTSAGKQITVPLSKLSSADQQYVSSLQISESPRTASSGLRYEKPLKRRLRMGLEVSAKNGSCTNVVATFPLPMSWPEQKVTVLDREVSPANLRVTTRTLNDGVQQVEFRVPRLAAGQSVHVIYSLEIERHQILPPVDPLGFVLPKKIIQSDLRHYLGESPKIEVKHAEVVRAAEAISIDASKPAWEQIETIYDWTRGRVKSGGTKPLEGALHALRTGRGDCEEVTSLFVAMCRIKGIPARSVWIEGHAYPEFYLQDGAGVGHWIPCESLGPRNFGGMSRYELILQKGDNFRMAQKQGVQRYVTATLSGSISRGGGQPVMREIRENL